MIKINFDFVDGIEVSYLEGCELKDGFTTNCLDFFNWDEETDNVLIIDKLGNVLDRNKLLQSNNYTTKEIRKTHNLQKMLKANSFNWR